MGDEIDPGEANEMTRARTLVQLAMGYLLAVVPLLTVAQGPAAGSTAIPSTPTGNPSGTSPILWVILAVLAIAVIWAVVRAQRRGASDS